LLLCDFHLRFGLIMSLVAKRDIQPGEEIFTSYNYDVQKAPIWYQVNIFSNSAKNQGEENLYSVTVLFVFRSCGSSMCGGISTGQNRYVLQLRNFL
jgi:hypothetical protein